jgi:hypothetical protein
VAIAAEDLQGITLALAGEGKLQQVVIQLMPAPFSPG